MTFGINITTYNRFDYLKLFLESFSKSIFIKNTIIHITDDCSSDERVLSILNSFLDNNKDLKISIFNNLENLGAQMNYKKSLLTFLDDEIDFVVNLDSDCIMNKNWLLELEKIIDLFGQNIICSTFFCEINLGNPNNKIVPLKEHNELYVERDSLNGLGICFPKKLLFDFLDYNMQKSFDSYVNIELKSRHNLRCINTSLSYIQHIGEIGVSSKPNFYDKSNNFIGE